MSNSPIPAERWRGILREHRASGLSVAAFCRETQVPQASFYIWRRKLQNGAMPSPRRGSFRGRVPPNPASSGPSGFEAASFVEVQLSTERLAEARAMELRLPGDRSVLIRPGFDRSTLVDLLATLEACDADSGSAPSAAWEGMQRPARPAAYRRISLEARR